MYAQLQLITNAQLQLINELLLTNSTMHELNLLTYANHQTTLIRNSSKSVNTIDSTDQKLIQGEEEPK